MRAILLTGSDLRHQFVRKALGQVPGVELVATVCEGNERNLLRRVQAQTETTNELRVSHLQARERAENDFFGPFVEYVPDSSRVITIAKGAINEPEVAAAVSALSPDLLLCYGSSIIREPLLSAFDGRFLNVHLGLSPYYRGSGTNFWPLVNGEPEFVGLTFMFIDAGVDTGEIIHQVRAQVFPGDTPHTIGNRLIGRIPAIYGAIARHFDGLPRMVQPPRPVTERYYRKADLTEDAVNRLYSNFADGMVERYLADQQRRDAAVPLVRNPRIEGVGVG